MSSSSYEVTSAARCDLDDIVFWFRIYADHQTATRFADAALDAFAKLALSPGIDSPVATEDRRLADLRKWRVDGFPNHLIFYQPIPSGVSVVRVLHGARDWQSLLTVDHGGS